jgi:hypothetical protein
MTKGKPAHLRKTSDHYRWNGGVTLATNGYLKVQVGKTHPLSDSNGYAYVHRLVAAASGLDIQGKVVHHKNGDPLDNRLENLEVQDRSSHNSQHNSERGRRANGQFRKRGE